MRRKIYTNKKEKPEDFTESKLKDVIGLILYCLIVIVVMYMLVRYVGQRTVVIGDSMNPTLEDGNNLITDKISYRFTDPKRFDIIVFHYKENTSQLLIKRIIGMPGETVQIRGGFVYINGQPLKDTYGNAVMDDAGIAATPIILGENEYFVLGDNRNNSQDSRFASVGNIKRSEIVGRAFVRVWPLNKLSLLKHQ